MERAAQVSQNLNSVRRFTETHRVHTRSRLPQSSLRLSGPSYYLSTPLMPRVLVVEDDPDIADLIRRYLQRGGFEVDVRASGREALSVIADQHPDLVILDLMLPQVSGLDVCRTLRADDKTSLIPIIMVTA